jgi:hypothetical protein
VSRFHLHARALEGPLQAPLRDEVRVAQADDPDEAEAWAHRYVDEGFTVWVYDHGTPARLRGASDYRLVAHYRPAGDTAPSAAPGRIPRTPPSSSSERRGAGSGPGQRSSATASAASAPRCPRGTSGPMVESRLVCFSLSALTSAPSSTM